MSKAQREEFLAGVHIGVMGIARPGGPPLTVPVWYQYEPGGDVRVQMSPDSVKFRLVDAVREFSLVVQVETPPYRYVSVSGPVVAVERDTSHADLLSMAHRYFDRDAAVDYVETIKDEAIVTLHMRPQRWYSTDYG
ncbi:pyridoxamine 5'-phosphate oxidase family protein [Actinosynnema sp. CS-041913]|uniref:pyridoxamine 5'-phosphate oxidase family protein n=1 Tax=Actinosynnema sp. CS-041913 TaxID=3239917 RepID=UPI003D9079D8